MCRHVGSWTRGTLGVCPSTGREAATASTAQQSTVFMPVFISVSTLIGASGRIDRGAGAVGRRGHQDHPVGYPRRTLNRYGDPIAEGAANHPGTRREADEQ